jgi:hypothetical protein
MSITSELQRLQTAKEEFEDLLTTYGNVLPENVKTEDLPSIITGMPTLVRPYVSSYQYGYINASTSTFNADVTWTYQAPAGAMNDIYTLTANHKYMCYICIPGKRFRAMYCTTDPTSVSSNISGKLIVKSDNPSAGATWKTNETPDHIFTAPYDCYLIVQKDNEWKAEIRTYLIDVTNLESPSAPVWVSQS